MARYIEACNYPGGIDAAAIHRHLEDYCAALGITRKIVRIAPEGWRMVMD
jgi:hypothetical protein